MDKAINCIRISQAIVVQPIAEADAPTLAQGETLERPIPVPKERRASDKAAATNAPAITAPQDTPELIESFVTAVPLIVECSIWSQPPYRIDSAQNIKG